MSSALPSLNRISRERLSSLLLTEPTDQKIVIVDVRDSDRIGGHIKSSRHVPSETLDYSAPDLARQLLGAEKVIFHCALSQQRGPSAALKYLRERERLFGAGSTVRVVTESIDDDEEPKERDEDGRVKKQEVYVLTGGFVEWQEKYGNDERLTESYNKQLWADGGNY